MSLDLLKALDDVSGLPKFQETLAGAYFCSAITFLQPGKLPDYWDLNYYNPEKGDIVHIHVSSGNPELKSVDKPLKKELPKKIDVGTIQIGIADSMRIATDLQKKEQNSTIQKIFVSLYSEDAAVWSIGFILGGMRIFQIKIDAGDGRVLDSKLHDFLQKQAIAS